MPVELTGDVFRAYGEQAARAIESIPDSERDRVLWQRPEIEDEPRQSLTAAQHAADIATALWYQRKTLGLETAGPTEPSYLEKRNALSERPMMEIAARVREEVEKTAKVIDDFSPEQGNQPIVWRNRNVHARVIGIYFLTHLVHHRSQLIALMRAVGLQPPDFVNLDRVAIDN